MPWEPAVEPLPGLDEKDELRHESDDDSPMWLEDKYQSCNGEDSQLRHDSDDDSPMFGLMVAITCARTVTATARPWGEAPSSSSGSHYMCEDMGKGYGHVGDKTKGKGPGENESKGKTRPEGEGNGKDKIKAKGQSTS